MLLETPDPEVQATLDAIRRIVRELREASSAVEKRLGISGAQLFVLQSVARAPFASLNEIASRTMTHQSSVSVVVSKLRDQGLVTRRRAPSDSRRWELSLTARGRSLLKRSPRMPQERLIDAASRLPRPDRRQLARCLTALVHAMGVDERAPSMFFEEPAKGPPRKR